MTVTETTEFDGRKPIGLTDMSPSKRAGIIAAYGPCITEIQNLIHLQAVDAGWWHDLETGEPTDRNTGELMMLMVTELAEAFEGFRKNQMDDHLPHRKMEEVELADAIIRILDHAGKKGFDIGAAMVEKLAYNRNRADHKVENRRKAGGKKV
jgi:hypothetical protein